MARRDCGGRLSDSCADCAAGSRAARSTRRDAPSGRGERARARRRGHALARHAVGGARHRGQRKGNRHAAARPAQLGRHAVPRAGCPGISVHRGIGRHVGRQNRRHQRARPSLAPEQLPARRRRQQQHLDQRAGAVDAALSPVDRRDWRVQSGDQPVHRRVRPRSGRDDFGDDQVRQQRAPRHDLLLLPRRADSTPTRSSPTGPDCRSRPTIRISLAAASAGRCEPAQPSSSPTTRARALLAASCAPAPCRRPTSATASSRLRFAIR